MARRVSRSDNAELFMRHGVPFLSGAGILRTPTLYHIAAAWAIAWASIPQVTVRGTCIRRGCFTHEEAAVALGATWEVMLAGCKDLERRQYVMTTRCLVAQRAGLFGHRCWARSCPATTHTCRNSSHAVEQRAGGVAGEILTQLRHAISALCRRALRRSPSSARSTSAGHSGEGSTLANMSSLPTRDNVGEWKYFFVTIKSILGRVPRLRNEKGGDGRRHPRVASLGDGSQVLPDGGRE